MKFNRNYPICKKVKKCLKKINGSIENCAAVFSSLDKWVHTTSGKKEWSEKLF